MKKDINFIGDEALRRSRLSRLKRKLMWGSIGVVLVLIILTIGLIIVGYWESRKINTLNSKTKEVLTQIKALANIESMVITVADRSKQASSLMEKRELIGWSFDILTHLQSLGVVLDKIDIKNNGALTIEAKCDSLKMLTSMYDYIESEKRSQRIESVSYDNVGYVKGRVNINLKTK